MATAPPIQIIGSLLLLSVTGSRLILGRISVSRASDSGEV